MEKIYRVEELDRNFAVEHHLAQKDVRFLDVRKEPFDIYGLYEPKTGSAFERTPLSAVKPHGEHLVLLHYHTAGGRVRFATDSPYIAIQAQMHYLSKMAHCAFTNSIGFDLYIDDPLTGESRFYRPFTPPVDIVDGYESVVYLPTDGQMRYYTIHFPTYSGVKNLYIGVASHAGIGHGLAYRPLDPVVYYGSSITQGGCASRAGLTYQSIITRHTNIDHINLGFSGNGQAQESVVNYINTLKMSAFVCDYDHNAPDAAFLQNTHEKLYQTIRAVHPDLPYIMITRPDWGIEYDNASARREVIMQTYYHAVHAGDANVYFIDGSSFFVGPDRYDMMVDNTHPNDIGFARMAEGIQGVLMTALRHKI